MVIEVGINFSDGIEEPVQKILEIKVPEDLPPNDFERFLTDFVNDYFFQIAQKRFQISFLKYPTLFSVDPDEAYKEYLERIDFSSDLD